LFIGGGPLLGGVLGGTPETLSEDGSGAGDRHLKFHDYRDNLFGVDTSAWGKAEIA
jgi:hypothetical protein